MDELVAEKYKELMKEGFKNAGSFEEPSFFIDSKAEGKIGRASCRERV